MKTSFMDTGLGGEVQTEVPAAVGGDLRERLRGEEITSTDHNITHNNPQHVCFLLVLLAWQLGPT